MSYSISVRQREILESIRANGFLTSREISQRWRISVGTARRDVDRLGAFDVVRSHGGGMLKTLSPSDGNRNGRQERALREQAIRLVEPGMSVGLCAGAHDFVLAQLLGGIERISIVTNSIRSAQLLWGIRAHIRSEIQVVLTPGQVNSAGELVGPLCTGSLRSLSFDLSFADAPARGSDSASDAENRESTDVFEAFRESSNRLLIVDGRDTVHPKLVSRQLVP
jgi:DeoR/GlpR family transcriptional regulator of sugar metabolism